MSLLSVFGDELSCALSYASMIEEDPIDVSNSSSRIDSSIVKKKTTATTYTPEFYKQNIISSQNPLKGLGAGDSQLFLDVLSEDKAITLFASLESEVEFHEMIHKGGSVPRLVAIQGQHKSIALADGSDIILEPIYRHPTEDDLSLRPMTPLVLEIKSRIEELLKVDGYDQEFNHVLIQKYRDGQDHINEHSDKTLDIERDTNIINFSAGASRTLFLKPKKDYNAEEISDAASSSVKLPTQKIALLHNSCFVCGWETNKQFLHGIKADKRAASEKRSDEVDFGCQRISLTFRSIATYRCRDRHWIIGQGAVNKSLEAGNISSNLSNGSCAHINDACEETLALLKAFSAENKLSRFEWDTYYGRGFDIVAIQL